MAFGVAGEDAARVPRGRCTFHAVLYDALYNLDPDTLDSPRPGAGMKLHAIVNDLEVAPDGDRGRRQRGRCG